MHALYLSEVISVEDMCILGDNCALLIKPLPCYVIIGGTGNHKTSFKHMKGRYHMALSAEYPQFPLESIDVEIACDDIYRKTSLDLEQF
jgi:hypothetical protein